MLTTHLLLALSSSLSGAKPLFLPGASLACIGQLHLWLKNFHTQYFWRYIWNTANVFRGARMGGVPHSSVFCAVASCRSWLSLEYRRYESGRHSDGGKSHCLCREANTSCPGRSSGTLLVNVYIFMARNSPVARTSSLSSLHAHTQTHSTLSRTPHRELNLILHNTHKQTRFHVPGGILTRTPSKRMAQTLSLDSAATGIGFISVHWPIDRLHILITIS